MSTVSIRLSATERREQLLDVAVDLFSRKGFKGTTTREIAAAAGVTEAIIFRHFETKEHLYKAIIDQRLNSSDLAEWVAGFRTAMDRDDDEAVVRKLIGCIIETHKNDPKFERLMMYASLEGNEIALIHMQQVTATVVDTFRKYLKRRQKKGRMREISPDFALAAIVGMAKHYALCKYIHGFSENCHSDEAAVDSFTQIAMEGLCLRATTKR